MSDTDYEDHTAILKSSRAEAERIADTLKAKGWEVYPEKVPLAGQGGYYCVSTWQDNDGEYIKRAHSVRWNIFGKELRPIVMNAQQETDILSFLWQHATHPGFDHFEYGDGDVGFVCYCRGNEGQSLVLRVGVEIEDELSQDAFELLWIYQNQGSDEQP